MGAGRVFSHVKLNLTDPCRTVGDSTTVEGCEADGGGHQFLYVCEYDAESPKQGRKRFNSIVKTINFSYLPIIYLWCNCNFRNPSINSTELSVSRSDQPCFDVSSNIFVLSIILENIFADSAIINFNKSSSKNSFYYKWWRGRSLVGLFQYFIAGL